MWKQGINDCKEKKIVKKKCLRCTGFGKNVCTIQTHKQVTAQVGRSLGESGSEHLHY